MLSHSLNQSKGKQPFSVIYEKYIYISVIEINTLERASPETEITLIELNHLFSEAGHPKIAFIGSL